MWSQDVIDAVTKHLASRMDDPRPGRVVAAAGGTSEIVDLLNRLQLKNPRVIAHLSCKDGGEFATQIINEAHNLNIHLSELSQAALPGVWNLCMTANAKARAVDNTEGLSESDLVATMVGADDSDQPQARWMTDTAPLPGATFTTQGLRSNGEPGWWMKTLSSP